MCVISVHKTIHISLFIYVQPKELRFLRNVSFVHIRSCESDIPYSQLIYPIGQRSLNQTVYSIPL